MPQVTPEDQAKLNEFSQKMMQRDRLAQELATLEFEKEQMDDVSLELEMVDEEEKVGYVLNTRTDIYESFVRLKPEEIIARLEERTEKLEGKIESLKEEIELLDDTMKGLKTQLYAKFGDSVNLER